MKGAQPEPFMFKKMVDCSSFLTFEYLLLLQLKDHRSLYEGYVPMKYKSYYKKMAKYVGPMSSIDLIS